MALLEKDESDPEKNLRGYSKTYTNEQIQFITTCYTGYINQRRKVKMTAFMKHLKTQWDQQTWLTTVPSRKTVDDMLLANGLRTPKVKPLSKSTYYTPVKKYVPHVQSVMDGKHVVVRVNDQSYSFVMEYSKDMATDAIGGSCIGKTETAELVKAAFENHRHNYQTPISTLIDNGRGNVKAAIDLGAEGTLFIRAYPNRPQTKGIIEGEFGLFERSVSTIHIQGTNHQELALSMLEQLSRLYIRLRNSSPRCSTCPFTPAKLMQANLTKTTADEAWDALKNERDKKQRQQQQRLKISQEQHELLDSVIDNFRLKGDRLRFKKSLNWVEQSIIKEAETLFGMYSQKDNFDESKRTMAYFSAIARNLQQKKDQAAKNEIARRRYGLDQKSKAQRKQVEDELALKKEQHQSEQHPDIDIVQAIQAHMNLPEKFRRSVKIYLTIIDEALQAVLRKNKKKQEQLIATIDNQIMKLTNLDLKDKYQWIEYINERLMFLINNKMEIVTPK